MSAYNPNCFGYYDSNSINSPYTSNITNNSIGLCLIIRSNELGKFYTVLCIPLGQNQIFMWSKYTKTDGSEYINNWKTF